MWSNVCKRSRQTQGSPEGYAQALASYRRMIVEETIQSLGNRLNKLNSLSSKGVHNEASLIKAESCLMWTSSWWPISSGSKTAHWAF
jgi:hypothetical protein